MSSAKTASPASTNLRSRTSWLAVSVAGLFIGCSGASGTPEPTPIGTGGTVSAVDGNGTTGGALGRGGATGSTASGGASAIGGTASIGGASLGGAVTGGTASGGTNTGGAATGGRAAGGIPSGGATMGGAATGGKAAGGTSSGGTSTGGAATGGKAAGGTTSGGATTGGAPTGGAATGGIATGGSATSGNATGGSGVAAPTAKAAATKMGKGFNLGQMFESTQHPRTLAKASAKIDAYYDKGFRNIRIPITWTELVGGDRLVNDPNVGDVNRTHARLAIIQQVVDYALSKPELYVIINAHHEVALKTGNRAAVLERLWQDIADIFGSRDHRLIYEILNEPHLGDATSSAMAPANLRNMTAMAYAKIRAVDPQRIVVIGGNQWFGAYEMAQVWPNLTGVGGGQDAYVMATFHHYDPWTFCGDNQGAYDDAWTESNLSGPMDTMLSWANSVGNGMPFYIGEWGVAWASRYTQLQCNNIRNWYQRLHSVHASTKGIPTSVWDDGGWFKIFDHSSDTFANNLSDCIGGTCTWDGTERFNVGCL